MSHGEDVLDNWEEIDEAGVSAIWCPLTFPDNLSNTPSLFAALHDSANEAAGERSTRPQDEAAPTATEPPGVPTNPQQRWWRDGALIWFNNFY